MGSEAIKGDPHFISQGVWEGYLYLGENQFKRLIEKYLRQKTILELVNGPYVLRFDLPKHGRVYFVGTDEPYLKLKDEGKNIRWLHELFQVVQDRLMENGKIAAGRFITGWTLQDVWLSLGKGNAILQMCLEVFPEAKVGVLE